MSGKQIFIMGFLQQFKRCGRSQCFCVASLQHKGKKISNPWIELKYEMERYNNCYYPPFTSITSTYRPKRALKKEHLKKSTRKPHPWLPNPTSINRKLK